METEGQGACMSGFPRGGVCRESVSARNVHPKAKREHGCWGRAEKNGIEMVPGCRLLPCPAER